MFVEIDDMLPLSHDDTKIWRFMDFEKLLHLLISKKMYFTRSDMFEDPFEGMISRANVALRPEVYKDSGLPLKIFTLSDEHSLRVRKFTFINCWHMNDYESAGMWTMYSSNKGIAIQSTIGRLKKSLKATTKRIYLSDVTYIDYETDWMPEGNIYYPFIHKRKSFDHEREIRAIYLDYNWSKEQELTGINIDIDLHDLIEKVYIAPHAKEWFAEIVIAVIKKYDFEFDIKQSDLYTLS